MIRTNAASRCEVACDGRTEVAGWQTAGMVKAWRGSKGGGCPWSQI